jgi:hypothetical protein
MKSIIRPLPLLATLIAVIFASGATPAQARGPAPTIDDLIIVVYEFEHSQTDRAIHVIFAGSEHARDRSPAKSILSEREKADGARIISQKQYDADPSARGKKRYDGLLFDLRVRRFVTKA